MSALPCAACACLRVTQAIRRQRVKTSFAELHLANNALLAAASGLSAALKHGMVSPSDVYELLRVIHLRLKQTITDAERAALSQDGAA